MRDLPEILKTATRIVADAVVTAKSTRNTNFALDKFHQHCKERQDVNFIDLLREFLKVPPDPASKTVQTATDQPLNETKTTAANDENY